VFIKFPISVIKRVKRKITRYGMSTFFMLALQESKTALVIIVFILKLQAVRIIRGSERKTT